MQPAQPDRPVSTIYNNIIGEGRAATDPSLDHFWRVLFGHFPKTVVKFIQKAPAKSTSKMVPMANSLAFWWRAGTTSTLHSDSRLPFQALPTCHPGLTSRASLRVSLERPMEPVRHPHWVYPTKGSPQRWPSAPVRIAPAKEPSAQTSPAHFAEELFSHHASRAEFSYTRKS